MGTQKNKNEEKKHPSQMTADEIQQDIQSKKAETKKKQAVSITYTLKSLGNNIAKLKEANYLTDDQAMIMEKIKGQAIDKYVKEQF